VPAPAWTMASAGYPEYAATRPLTRTSVTAYTTADWSGAFITVTLGMLVMGLSLMLLLLVSGEGNAGPSLYIGFTALTIAQAFGGDLRAGPFAFDGFGGAHQLLGPALLGFAVMGLWYVRRLRLAEVTSLVGVVGQAVRCLVVLIVELLVDVLLSYVGTGSGDASIHADVPTTLGFGVLTVIVVLVIAGILGLRDLRPVRVERVREVVAGPLGAVMTLFVASMAVVLVVAIVLLARGTSLSGDVSVLWRGAFVLVFLQLPNIAATALAFGIGVPVDLTVGQLFGGSAATSQSAGVFDLAGHDGVYWLWPLIALLLMVGTGYLAGRWSPVTAGGRSLAPVLGAVLPVMLLLVALVTRSTPGLGGLTGLVDAHFDFPMTLVLGAAWGLGAGLLGMLMAGHRPPPPPLPEIPEISHDQPVFRWTTADYPLVEGADQALGSNDPFSRRFGIGQPPAPPQSLPPQSLPPQPYPPEHDAHDRPD
jgi:hypothetical protein